jgi:hypothetical protein
MQLPYIESSGTLSSGHTSPEVLGVGPLRYAGGWEVEMVAVVHDGANSPNLLTILQKFPLKNKPPKIYWGLGAGPRGGNGVRLEFPRLPTLWMAIHMPSPRSRLPSTY